MSAKLLVGVDGRTLNVPHMRGTGRYIYEQLRNTRPGDDVQWVVYGHDRSHPLQVPEELQGRVEIFEARGHRFNVWEQWALPRRLRAGGIAVYHGADNTAPIRQPCPTVVTIHDTGPWEEPAPTLERFNLHVLQSAAFRCCARIITISEASRRSVVQRWPFLSDRLVVIPHGIADEYFDPATVTVPAKVTEALKEQPYLLFLGGPHRRKRFTWALEILSRCGRADLHLVGVGFGARADASELVPAELRGRVHFAPFLQERELVAVYRGAAATLYPTTYEGFGFPAIESQAAGTPILFSPVTSLVDLVGPLAWTMALEDMEGWLAALRAVLSLSPEERARRRAEAAAWVRRFSWRASIEAHQRVYREMAAG